MSLNFKFVHENKPQIAVLLFHGMTGSPFEMKKLGKYLFENGFDVYCDCLPGHGISNINIKEVKYQDWYNYACSKYLKLSQDYEKVFLTGLCLGAVLALSVAATYQDISGVIALSTTLFLDGWAIPWYNFLLPLGLHTIIRYYYTFPEREPYGIKNEKIRKKINMLQKKNSVALDNYPLSCIYELLKLSKFVQKSLYQIDAPVLLLHSKEDDLASIKSPKLIYNKIPSQIKEYIELQNSYHLIVLDNDKEFVFEKTKQFILENSQIYYENKKRKYIGL